jgi:hypothetical protein
VPKYKITYCMVVLNRLKEMQFAIRRAAPYVTRTCVVDGGSIDGTIEWLGSQECKDLNVSFKVSKQHRYATGNHTPQERNQYLEMAGNGGHLIYTDSDEFLEEEAYKNFDRIIDAAEANSYNGISFNSHDIWPHEDGEIYDAVSNYWNPMMWKGSSGQHYVGHTHSSIYRPNIVHRWMKSGFEYKHVKTERRMWHNSTFLYWTTAEIAQNTTNDSIWQNFHKVMQKHGYVDWHELNKDMNTGTLPQEIKDLFIEYKEGRTSEERSWFVWYYIFLHPEENVDKLSNQDRPWNYVEQCRIKRLEKGIPDSVVSLSGDLEWLKQNGKI